MPVEMERELRAQFKKNHPNGSKEEEDAYVYGTMRKTGWKPSTQRENLLPGDEPGFRRWSD